MGSILLKVVIAYAEAHPDQMVSLIEAGVDALISHLKVSKAASSVAK